jgi:hypothetical protein
MKEHQEVSNSGQGYVLATNSGTVGRRMIKTGRKVACPQCVQRGSVSSASASNASTSPSAAGSSAGVAGSVPPVPSSSSRQRARFRY